MSNLVKSETTRRSYNLIYEFDPLKKCLLIYEARPEWTPGSRKTHGLMRSKSYVVARRLPLPDDIQSFSGPRVRVIIYSDLSTLLNDEKNIGASDEFVAELETALSGKMPYNPVAPQSDLFESGKQI